MEKQNYQISLIGKIIVIVAAIFSIVMVNGIWLDLYQVPMLFGDSIPHEYTLHDISDFLEIFNMYLDDTGVDFYATLFSVGATVIIIINVILIILSFVNTRVIKSMAGLSLLASVVITGVFLFAINQINAEMKEVTYGGVKELLRTTDNPYWLIGFSVLSCVGSNIKKKVDSNHIMAAPLQTTYVAKEKCSQCGAEIAQGSTFCNECGSKIAAQTQNSKESKFCTSCGAKIPMNAGFCTECGNKAE